jgi:hypothetical protein
MATFYAEAEVDVEPDEFLEKCTDKELKEIYESLKEDYEMEEKVEEESVRSEGQRNFNRYLRALKENWITVSKEDTQIIEVLGKKYGAV